MFAKSRRGESSGSVVSYRCPHPKVRTRELMRTLISSLTILHWTAESPFDTTVFTLPPLEKLKRNWKTSHESRT